jgi:hypothetical protein
MRTPLCVRRVSAVAVVLAIAIPVCAQSSLEYNVKAALLLNFARFIEWPAGAFADAHAPIQICVFAPSPFGEALHRVVDGETVGERPVTAREVHKTSDSVGCHLLFVPASAEERAVTVLRSTAPHTVTVGESRQFEQMGGAVNLVVDSGRVRFNVNLQPVEERGVRISARMLHLATRVDRTTPQK